MGEDRTPDERQLVTVAKAAELLGISAEAVRMRLRRGTLDSERHEGTIYVLLDTDQTQRVADVSTDRTDLLIATLQEQLEQANERDRENRRIIAALTSRIPALEAPQEATGGGETLGDEPERAEPRSAVRGAQEGAERPWWRRMFGG